MRELEEATKLCQLSALTGGARGTAKGSLPAVFAGGSRSSASSSNALRRSFTACWLQGQLARSTLALTATATGSSESRGRFPLASVSATGPMTQEAQLSLRAGVRALALCPIARYGYGLDQRGEQLSDLRGSSGCLLKASRRALFVLPGKSARQAGHG